MLYETVILSFVIPTGVLMGPRPTQGDEKRFGPATTLYGTIALSLSSRAKPRDLRFYGPVVEMFFDRAKRSGGTYGSTHPSWKPLSTDRSRPVPPARLAVGRTVEGSAVPSG
jgi:hypothetical protein